MSAQIIQFPARPPKPKRDEFDEQWPGEPDRAQYWREFNRIMERMRASLAESGDAT